MPIPESELFKSQKPKVPPTFNGVDYDDTSAFKAAEDAIIREQWVNAMKTRIVGEELSKCYFREGVNHLENCGHLRSESGQHQSVEACNANQRHKQRRTWTCSSRTRSRALSGNNNTISPGKMRQWTRRPGSTRRTRLRG